MKKFIKLPCIGWKGHETRYPCVDFVAELVEPTEEVLAKFPEAKCILYYSNGNHIVTTLSVEEVMNLLHARCHG